MMEKLIENFGYKGQSITICKEQRHNAYVYGVIINGRKTNLTSKNEKMAKRKAKKYVELNYKSNDGILYTPVDKLPLKHKLWAKPLHLIIRLGTKLVNLFNKAVERIIYR